MKKFQSDIDIDLADRAKLLDILPLTPASIKAGSATKKHNTGVYSTSIPVNPLTGLCSIDYNTAEERGYIKLDLLNVWVYKHVTSESHLIELMCEPDWGRLKDRDFFEKLIHIGKHYSTMCAMPEPITTVQRMAMFLALIRPGKRHLIGKSWSEVVGDIWSDSAGGYQFKKSHSVAYAQLVVVNMNLLSTGLLTEGVLQE